MELRYIRELNEIGMLNKDDRHKVQIEQLCTIQLHDVFGCHLLTDKKLYKLSTKYSVKFGQ